MSEATTAAERAQWLSDAQRGIDGTHQGRSKSKLLNQADKVTRLVADVDRLEGEAAWFRGRMVQIRNSAILTLANGGASNRHGLQRIRKQAQRSLARSPEMKAFLAEREDYS